MVTHKSLTEKAGLSEKIATFLVSTVGCRTVEDPETCGGAGRRGDHPSHRRPGCPTCHGQPTERADQAIQEAARVSRDKKRKGAVEDRMSPLCHWKI